MSKNINTFAAGLLALTSIAAASVGCQPQASEQTAANPTEFVEQTETVETEAASTFELTEEPTEEPTAEPVETPTEPTAEPTEPTVPDWVVSDPRGIIPADVMTSAVDGIVSEKPGYATCVTQKGTETFLQIWTKKGLEQEWRLNERIPGGFMDTLSYSGENILAVIGEDIDSTITGNGKVIVGTKGKSKIFETSMVSKMFGEDVYFLTMKEGIVKYSPGEDVYYMIYSPGSFADGEDFIIDGKNVLYQDIRWEVRHF